MNTIPKFYLVETGDYLQISEGFNPMDAVKNAFRKKEPTEAGILTEVHLIEQNGTDETFFVNTVNALKAVGFIVE